jgi:putative phage-type endonuclease
MSQTHEEWLEQRRKGLGGSDIAAMMGLSPWKSRFQLWQDKKGIIPHTSESEVMEWGKRMEPTLRQFYADQTGRPVRVANEILYHQQYPIFFANPDGLTDCRRIVEMKVARHPSGWGQPGTSEVPDNYALQVQHYMFVTGFEVADVVVTIGGGYPRIYTVPADKEIHAVILEEGLKFWKQVEENIAPEPISYTDAVAKFGMNVTVGVVFASPETVQVAEQLSAVRAQLDELEAKEEDLKGKMIVAMGADGDSLVDKDGRALATYKLISGRKTLDTKAIEKNEPSVYAQYLKVGAPSRRFLLKI